MDHRIIFADVLDGLRSLESESINCVATSPPYWGLRDYGAEGQIGLEETPEAYVARLVEVFAEVRRVLRSDGTLWLNLGDSYAGGANNKPHTGNAGVQGSNGQCLTHNTSIPAGLKPKDLCGIPWRVAFALQADGWWLRNDIIWAKKNPMPESVTDRFSTKHEHVFLLSKQARYWFDLDAVREEHTHPDAVHNSGSWAQSVRDADRRTDRPFAAALSRPKDYVGNPLGKNPGDVWRIATKPTPYAHFATWPPDLVERMILAGCPPKVCAKCGEPWTIAGDTKWVTEGFGYVTACYCGTEHLIPQEELDADPTLLDDFEIEPPPPVPGVVLDPFAGSGTTTQVARKLGRRSIGIELNPDYEAVMRERLDLPPGGSLFADEDLGVEFVTLDVAEVTG
jgi:DNA modification methylase